MQIRGEPMGISKYMLKKEVEIPTTKQFDGLMNDLLDKNFVRVELRELPGNQQDSGNYFFLEPKGFEFLEMAEELLTEFLNMEEIDPPKWYD